MSPHRFAHLLTLIEPFITKKSTNFREPISAGKRLSLTLRFLATGESQRSLSFAYRIGSATVSKFQIPTDRTSTFPAALRGESCFDFP